MDPIICTPIGFVRTPYQHKYDAPRQPEVDDRVDAAVIELLPHENFEQALEDLAGIERIWLLTWFDRADSWKPKVLTPRDRTKRGVFATRSPHRPNPLGLSCVRLIEVKGRMVYVEGTDLLDGTPVLDIKPYVPYADAFPDASVGWLDRVSAPQYTVVVDTHVPTEAAHLVEHARRVLAFDPMPHPYRRTRSIGDGTYELAMQQWRCSYQISGNVVTITAIVLQS
jgi:tRNA-Thr(GGU) m(6)t(6)A37 methyltransferase TsaA